MIKIILNLLCIVLIPISSFGILLATKLEIKDTFIFHLILLLCVYFIGYKYIYVKHKGTKNYVVFYLTPYIFTYSVLMLRTLGVDVEFPIAITIEH